MLMVVPPCGDDRPFGSEAAATWQRLRAMTDGLNHDKRTAVCFEVARGPGAAVQRGEALYRHGAGPPVGAKGDLGITPAWAG